MILKIEYKKKESMPAQAQYVPSLKWAGYHDKEGPFFNTAQ